MAGYGKETIAEIISYLDKYVDVRNKTVLVIGEFPEYEMSFLILKTYTSFGSPPVSWNMICPFYKINNVHNRVLFCALFPRIQVVLLITLKHLHFGSQAVSQNKICPFDNKNVCQFCVPTCFLECDTFENI